MRTSLVALCSILLTPWCAGQEPPVYPEGAEIPRSLTEVEARWLRRNPLSALDGVTPPPTGPVHCAAEYEPMAGILIAWEGSSSWLTILRQMAFHITRTGNADVYVVVDSASEQNAAHAALQATEVVMSRVKFLVRTTDTIWIRDYGPRYIYQGDCRAVVDHTYNRPRPNDNALNRFVAPFFGHALYELGLVHGGGNYHLDAVQRSRTTRLINNENPTLSEPEIHDIWRDYQNVSTTFYQPFPRTVDSTQHIDMWMQVVGDNEVMISTWPNNPGSTQAQICDAAAVSMAAEGYTVHRVPARSVGGTHYTYTNVVLCNGLVLIPSYTNSTVAPHNSQALAAWQAAMPGKTVVQINCQAIVTSAGVMHCIVMHVPSHRGGLDPTAYLVNLNAGEVLVPGSAVEIQWITDDDESVVDVDLLLSNDGGQTFPTVLASQIPDTGTFSWTVPSTCTGQARVRVVARDAQGRTGSDDSDASFTIRTAGCTAASIPYGVGAAGQNGVPTLNAGAPILGTALDIDLANAWPNAPAFVLFGPAQAATPYAGATVLVQVVGYFPQTVSPSGTATLTLPVPPEPALIGQSMFWQTWIANDPGAAGGWATTAGLETRLGL